MNNKVLVIGATGQIGRLTVAKLNENNFNVHAMVRDPAGCVFPEAVEVVAGDLEKDFSNLFNGIDTVIFTAGSGGSTGADKTLLVDLWGAKKAIDAALEHHVQHFIMVSARFAGEPDRGPEKIKHYLVAKHFADQYLIQSDLNYTILRLGRLTNDSGSGSVNCDRPQSPEGQTISREDSASAIAYCVHNRLSYGKVTELYQGDTPISSLFTK